MHSLIVEIFNTVTFKRGRSYRAHPLEVQSSLERTYRIQGKAFTVYL